MLKGFVLIPLIFQYPCDDDRRMYPFFALDLAAKPVYFSLVQTLFHFPTHYTVNALSGYPIILFLVIMAKMYGSLGLDLAANPLFFPQTLSLSNA